MTDSNTTAIGLLIDRTGSMSAIRTDAEGGINTFIKEQKDEPGEAYLWMADFDTVSHDVIHRDKNLSEVQPNYRLIPRGGTPLYDSMARMITELGEDLAAKSEDNRPSKVLMVIMTDGHENSSREWTHDKLQKLVKQQQDEWNWEFIFLSSEPDAIDAAIAMGVPAANTVVMGKSGADYYAGTQTVNSAVRNFRKSGNVEIEDNDLRGKVKK